MEAEAFADRGGWVLDPQFMDQTGSPYLLAHGLGKPVAKTTGQMGLAVGAAAFLCQKHDTTPRGVYQRHLAELQDIVFEAR